jgi:pre-mRNA-splicing factor CWC26
MSSKLDYLSKYYNNDTAADSKKKKKDKKGKKKRKEAAVSSLRVVDEEEAFASQLARDHPAEEDQEEDEDGPVVVNPEAVPTLAASSSRSSRGQWQEVEERPGTRRPRYDSSDAEGNTLAESEFSKANRRRLDSDDEPVNRRTASSVQKKQRYDSDEDDDDPRRKGGAPLKKESDDDGMAIKEEDEDQQRGISSQRKKARYDSDEESAAGGGGGQSAAKRDRHDSSSSQDSDDNSARRMSSGHRAGLQTGQLFSKAETEIQKKRKMQAQGMVDRYGMGETVHRGQPKDQTPAALTAAQQAELNQGRAQKLKAAQERQQMERIQQSDFARRVDDDEMETLRKQALRAGDPMAQYAQKPIKKSSNSTPAEARLSRPVYKGPPAKSNRFGIRPGFRWDGNDRGIGFEDRLLGQRSGQNHRQEEAYRWSSAGM